MYEFVPFSAMMSFNFESCSYLSESVPFLAMMSLSFESPPTGTLSVPVVNCRSFLFCSSEKSWTIVQKFLKQDENDIDTLLENVVTN